MFLLNFLEDLIHVDSKKLNKLSNKPNKWWNEPKENYMYYDLKHKGFVTLSIVFWIFSSIFFIVTINTFNTQNPIFIIWGILFVLFTICGFLLIYLSTRSKKYYFRELEKYQNAINNKRNVDEELIFLYKKQLYSIESTIKEELTSNSEIEKLDNIVFNVIDLFKILEIELNEMYYKNKIYDYNVNEPMEVQSFSSVDSLSVYEDLYERLYKLIRIALSCKTKISNNDYKSAFVFIEELLNQLDIEINYNGYISEGGVVNE